MAVKATISDKRSFLLFGTTEAVPKIIPLRAGKLQAELVAGNLRHIVWGDIEILRGITFAVRDTGWGTNRLALTALKIEQLDTQFTVSYRSGCTGPDGDFSFEAYIQGRENGGLLFEADGLSRGGFKTNRTGFVLLHPLAGTVGKALKIRHTGCNETFTRFPDLVEPGTPASDIEALVHHPRSGLNVTLEMSGGPYEMEDHRNWTDASFKTYIRPLAFGFPYDIAAGGRIRQSVKVRVTGAALAERAQKTETTVSVGTVAEGKVPKMGLFCEPNQIAKALVVADQVRKIDLAFITARVDLRTPDLATQLSRWRNLAAKLTTPLALQIVVSGRQTLTELAPLARMLDPGDADIESLMIVPARDLKSRQPNCIPEGEEAPEIILAAGRKVFPHARLGGGMVVPFPELNRNRPASGIDFVTHATQATMHDSDDASVMETLEALPHIFRTVRSFAGQTPYRIGPATIGMPSCASASQPVANPNNIRTCMAENETRQRSLFGATFALAYASIGARHEIEALTFAAPTGLFGLFDAHNGARRPIAEIVSALASLKSAQRLTTKVRGSASVTALAVRTGTTRQLWLANLSASPARLRIIGENYETVEFLKTDCLSLSPAVAASHGRGDCVYLEPYALCRLSRLISGNS